MSVTPPSASVVLGNTQTFAATVTNTNDGTVAWSVNGLPGGNAAVGTISVNGVYTAPADLSSAAGPPPVTVRVTATSNADPAKSATATLTITSDIAVALTPGAAGVELGATQHFAATVASAGHPDTAVRWSVSGAACPSSCGTVDASGNYTAPQIMPAQSGITLTAQSVADPSRQDSASLVITSGFSLLLSAPASVPAGTTATIAATFTPPSGSNPSEALAWSLSGSGCSGPACGVLTVLSTQPSGGASISDSAAYTAPESVPAPNTVTITVTPQADPSKTVQATIAIQAGVGVSVSPATDTLAANHRVTLTAQVNGAASANVNWSVNGVAGGTTAVGQICVVASSPCQPVTSPSVLQVDYVAPGAIPTPNPVTVQVTSVADSTKTASAAITILNHVVVTVLPSSLTLAPLTAQTFTPTVLGTSNQSVVWQVQGTACGVPAVCGSVDTSGNYTAPDAAPSPDTLQVLAISADDTTQSGAANITISSGTNIAALHPSSVYAGAANGFTLRVEGGGFVASSPGPGSTLLVAGTPRITTCSSPAECTGPLTSADVLSPGNVTVQIENPAGTRSNTVSLVVSAPNAVDDVITLSSAAPSATAKDIVAVEPTTAGISVPGDDLDLNVAALGTFSTATNSCVLAGNPVALARPTTGIATADICLFSQSGFDTSMAYTVSGPGDLTVISKQPAGLGIIHLTLQIPSTAQTGARTLFIQNTNLDKTAASGALEVN